MSNEQSLQEFESLIRRVDEAKTDDFFEIAQILGLNPLTDYAGADLHKVNLSGKNLQEANLRKTNLSGADLRETNLRGADLSYADLRGADLRGADLREADLTEVNLNNASVENAKFGNNYGIYESIRLDLIRRGVSFLENPKHSNSINADKNLLAYRMQKDNDEWFRKHKGKYVAFVEGKQVETVSENENELHQWLNTSDYRVKERLVVKVEEQEIIDQPIHGGYFNLN